MKIKIKTGDELCFTNEVLSARVKLTWNGSSRAGTSFIPYGSVSRATRILPIEQRLTSNGLCGFLSAIEYPVTEISNMPNTLKMRWTGLDDMARFLTLQDTVSTSACHSCNVEELCSIDLAQASYSADLLASEIVHSQYDRDLPDVHGTCKFDRCVE